MEDKLQPAYIEEADEILKLADKVLKDESRTDQGVYMRLRRIVSDLS